MTQLYIPALKDRIRLLEPLFVEVTEDSVWGLHSTAWAIERPGEPWNYLASKTLPGFTLEAGTVLEFKRYFISTHAKEDRVKVVIFASPRRDLFPRSRGGTGQTIDMDLSVAVLNRIEYEKMEEV
jgi:hypothetical protein